MRGLALIIIGNLPCYHSANMLPFWHTVLEVWEKGGHILNIQFCVNTSIQEVYHLMVKLFVNSMAYI